MNFLSPIAFIFAASIPVVVLFYMLKRKRVVKLVSSTLLWQRFLAESQASSPLQKLRHNWLMLLQILLLLLVVLALARPFFTGHAQPSRLRVVVLDASASMQSTDVSPSRFDAARQEALGWVDGLRDDEQMMILWAGANTEVRQSPTSDKTALRRALENCQPTDSPTRLSEALKTAGAFTFEKQGEETVTSGEIHLFSDGAVKDLDELANQNLPIFYHRVGRTSENAGIVSLDVKSNPENPVERAIFTAVSNPSTNRFDTDIELLFNDRLLEVRPLALNPTNTEPLVFFAPQTEDGVFQVRLKIEDALAADNQASIMSLLPQPVQVLLVTRGNRFLEKGLRGASPLMELTVAGSVTQEGDDNDFDVVVLDDVIPAIWPTANTLAIHTFNTNWFSEWAPVEAPVIVDWRSTHPLLRFVSFDNVQIAETMGVQRPAWGLPLVESPATPLILAGELDQRRLIWIGFDTLQSTWPLRISYPIFLANAMDWLNPANMKATQLLVRAGEAFRLNLFEPIDQASVRLPSGESHPLILEPDTREIVFSDTARQGTYQLQTGTNLTTFCVNLLHAEETDITPRNELPMGKYESLQATTLRRANLEIWRWIALVGLGFLLGEWWYYHKRTV